nr:helix-turn-helix transcriptional regulator [uncultured Sphaerochaeta sp.]
MNSIGRKLDFYVVSYMKEGSSTLVIDGKRYEAHAGDVLIIPPNTMHDHIKETNETTCFMWWHFNYKICNTMDVLSLYDLPILFHIEDDSQFQSVFSEYLIYKDRGSTLSDYILAEAKAIELVGVLLTTVLCNAETKLYKSINNPFVLMLGDIVENPVAYSSLGALSEKYHLHQTYISNQFKKLFKISPVRLAQQVSINRAQLMLSYDHRMPIYEIAQTLGYEEPGNFTRFFKAKTGMSPQDYRAFSMNNYQALPLPNFFRWGSGWVKQP